ncbi:hypothetical protein LPJ78_004626 [Coemansia sp. RSA 989]|nr:hypothetical protein LPJ68_003587 [Coemansia sp. RSA 1086]KAJ1862582.1 hypothetical protein LPJ78_004626 [Coemansia sp. RSA 989]KAJ2668357.1 hypothetical protein IWW42_005253 [Coemansia sp. RSA 1085]
MEGSIEDLSNSLKLLVVNSNSALIAELKKKLPKESEVIDEVADKVQKGVMSNIYSSVASISSNSIVPKEEPVDHCMHTLTRGPNQGKYCQRPKTRTSNYCSTHKKVHKEDEEDFKLVDEQSGLYQFRDTPILVTAKDISKPVGRLNHTMVAQIINGEVQDVNDETRAIAAKNNIN